jgi:hypothetical protein
MLGVSVEGQTMRENIGEMLRGLTFREVASLIEQMQQIQKLEQRIEMVRAQLQEVQALDAATRDEP